MKVTIWRSKKTSNPNHVKKFYKKRKLFETSTAVCDAEEDGSKNPVCEAYGDWFTLLPVDENWLEYGK